MNLVRLIDFLRDRLQTVVRVCYALLALVVVADIVRWYLARSHHEAAPAGEHHATGLWANLYVIAETTPVFWSVFGFLAFLFIVFFAKWYGHRGILTREDYYNE